MSDQIYWILQVAIHPGKLEDFRSVANDLIAKTKLEPGTLGYQWNLSDDESICHIYERYQNAEALLTHVQSFGAFAKHFMEACHPTSFHVYGPANDAVVAALDDLQPVYFSELGGFSR